MLRHSLLTLKASAHSEGARKLPMSVNYWGMTVLQMQIQSMNV